MCVFPIRVGNYYLNLKVFLRKHNMISILNLVIQRVITFVVENRIRE